MQLTPELKAQLAEQKKQCVYCKITAKEIPSKVVFEDDAALAILDIYPAKKGHVIFTLKEHYPIMPLIPAKELAHFFRLVPALSRAIQSAMVATGINLFIASGGAAGQQFPHFLGHFFPRDKGDGFYNFLFKPGKSLDVEKVSAVQRQLLTLMHNYFSQTQSQKQSKSTGQLPLPASRENAPPFLHSIEKEAPVLYQDEKVLCVIPQKSAVPGHLAIYSKTEERTIGKLSPEDSTHLFITASFAASALFDGLGAQGTNILLKSGFSDDNPEGRLCVHILPRFMGDSLQGMLWSPKPPDYNLDEIASKIKDKTWNIKYPEPAEKEYAEKKREETFKGVKIQKAKTKTEEEIEGAIGKVLK